MESVTFRILTINTWKGNGAYEKRLPILARAIKALSPDVVCCQEVLQSGDGRYDTAQFLSRRLDMSFRFVPARYKERTVNGKRISCYSGLAILTRWWIASEMFFHLPSSTKDGGRKAQLAVLKARDLKVLFINVHFSHLPSGSELRSAQLSGVLDHPWCRKSYDGIFLCGDFNSDADSHEIQIPFQRSPLRYQDAYLSGGGVSEDITYPVPSPGQAVGVCGRRIDHLFSLASTTGQHPLFQNAQTVFGKFVEDEPAPSDHLGVAVDVTLTPFAQSNPELSETINRRGKGMYLATGQETRVSESP